jgi:hypothetical protein
VTEDLDGRGGRGIWRMGFGSFLGGRGLIQAELCPDK